MHGLIFWAAYFAPSMVAWYRVRNGKTVVPSLNKLVLFNLFLGWTVVGWIIPMANALGFNPVAWMALHLLNVMPSGQMGNAPGGLASSSSQSSACSQCQGSGSMRCSSCSGRGSWYDAPQGATGTAQLRTCSACVSSGHLRCTYCSGTGRLSI